MHLGHVLYINKNKIINKSHYIRLVLLLLLLLLSRFSHVQLCATPQTAAHQAPPSLGFSRQEYWSGVPLPSLKMMLPLSYFSFSTSQFHIIL